MDRGRQLKQQKSLDKKAARQETLVKSRKRKHQNKYRDKTTKPEFSKYQLKQAHLRKEEKAERISTEQNSDTGHVLRDKKETKNNVPLPLLTSLFNNGEAVKFIKKHKKFKIELPAVPKNCKNIPCLVSAQKSDDGWTLSRYFKHSNKDQISWQEQKIELPNDNISEFIAMQLLSNWNWAAQNMGGEKQMPTRLFKDFKLVKDFGKTQRMHFDIQPPPSL